LIKQSCFAQSTKVVSTSLPRMIFKKLHISSITRSEKTSATATRAVLDCDHRLRSWSRSIVESLWRSQSITTIPDHYCLLTSTQYCCSIMWPLAGHLQAMPCQHSRTQPLSFAAAECGRAGEGERDVTTTGVCLTHSVEVLVGSCSCKPATLAKWHQLSDYTHSRYYSHWGKRSLAVVNDPIKTLILFTRGHWRRDHDRDQIIDRSNNPMNKAIKWCWWWVDKLCLPALTVM